jgi:hypothetical protein
MYNRYPTLLHQFYRLKLEFAAEIPPLHQCAPVDRKTSFWRPSNQQQDNIVSLFILNMAREI